MNSIFVTGSTGYIGSYVVARLIENTDQPLALLVRAKSDSEAEKRLWKSLQLHMDFPSFHSALRNRIEIVRGDLTEPKLGLSRAEFFDLAQRTESIVHIAASLNRKSSKVCFNVNLRGTLEVVELARAADEHHGLRRFSDVSTVAVCGERRDEVVDEQNIVDWNLSDYDPYARTKKFAEHMVRKLLPDVSTVVFRPSVVLGDSRFPETTQFDMARAFFALSNMRVIPLDRNWRIDIVPADYVADAIAQIHMETGPVHESYNLSAGKDSMQYHQVASALHEAGFTKPMWFVPQLERTFTRATEVLMGTPRKWGISTPASVMRVFMPYLAFNTVFDNTRVCEALGRKPTPFPQYAYGLLRFVAETQFEYPYKAWPAAVLHAESTAHLRH